MINPAPGFRSIFGALGPTAGPGSPWNGPRFETYCRLHQTSAPETTSKSHAWALCVFGTDRKNIAAYHI